MDENGDKLDRHVSYLDVDCGEGDYWSDFGFMHARELMDGFSDTDWVKLCGVCATKGTAWQIRCAEMLDGTVNSAALEILTSLMTSRNRDVVMAAAETLLSLG